MAQRRRKPPQVHAIPAGLLRLPDEHASIESWTAAVHEHFGPLVRRKSLLHRHRQVLRTELVNLAKVAQSSIALRQLKGLVQLYRRVYRIDRAGTLAALSTLFKDQLEADRNWMDASLRATQRASSAAHDDVAHLCEQLDQVLEGSTKARCRLLYAIATRVETGAFPADAATCDFGVLVTRLPARAGRRFRGLLYDPSHGVPAHQWRNVAAHRGYAVRSSRTVTIRYGKAPNIQERTITIASLRRTLAWAILSLSVLRLASVLVYLEYMPDLRASGLAVEDIVIRFESVVVQLCHNLQLVGFRCLRYVVEGEALTLDLQDTRGRVIVDATIHASQVLDQLARFVRHDPSLRPTPSRVGVRVIDDGGAIRGSASVLVADAMAFVERRLTQRAYVDRIAFDVPTGQ